jgi:hypothetical protein
VASVTILIIYSLIIEYIENKKTKAKEMMEKQAKAKAVELINFFTPLVYDGGIDTKNGNEVQIQFAKTCSMKVVVEQINEGRLLGNYRFQFWQMVYDYIKEYDGKEKI